MRLVVVGIPGVGKSTVIDGVLSKMKGAKLVNFGTVMQDEGLSRRWVKDRDELRKMPVEKQRRLQKLTAAKISKMRENIVLVDTHLFIRTPEGYWPGLPFDVVRALKPTHLVLVEATPEEVAARRSADRTRHRDAPSRESLSEELMLARAFLAVSSNLSGAPMVIVENRDGKSGEASERIAEMIEAATR